MSKTSIETLKFMVRMALLILVPVFVAQAANLTGFWGNLVGVALPVVLPIVDKWIYLDDRIPARGIVPF
jgi:hypothetical protein